MPEMLLRMLATWRLTRLLVKEDGPWDMFGKTRDFFGIRFNSRGIAYVPSGNSIGKMLLCLWCTSIWTGILMAFIPVKYFLPLSLSAGALLVEKVISYEPYPPKNPPVAGGVARTD